jgi:hypothetical protein
VHCTSSAECGVVAAGFEAEVNLGQVFTGSAGRVILRVPPMGP